MHLWYLDSLHSHLQFSFTIVAVTDVDQIVTCPSLVMTFRKLDLALAPHVALNETQALVLIIEIETDGRDSFHTLASFKRILTKSERPCTAS